jgi:hypothetical protein
MNALLELVARFCFNSKGKKREEGDEKDEKESVCFVGGL